MRNSHERKQRSISKTRQSPVNAMDDEEKTRAIKGNQVKLKRCRQSIKRLQERLQQTPSVTINSVTDAVNAVKKAYSYIASKKEEAMKLIIDAVIDMETSNRIPKERQDDRDRYAEFIVSDIVNACKTFTGNNKQIRFHPIMANLAMNLYMGMKYDDIVDIAPFVFPTVRTIQRHREKIATHEGTDPKVYARVPEMSGFTTVADKLVHWLFDEVKLTSGVAWNSRNDEFRGLCCGTKGSLQELKDNLEDLEELLIDTRKSDTTTCSGEGRNGIYCNQWLARNPFGTTLLGEFFYNEGNLDGNEIMRQFLQVTTSASLAGLETIGLVSDMGGSNDRFYKYLRDGKIIQPANLWPTDHVVVKNPVNPNVNISTWGCSTHGLKNVRSQLEMSRRDGSGSRQFHTAHGVPFGWWLLTSALDRDVDREVKSGGNFRTTLSKQAVDLDSFSKMNASLAKQPFTEKTLAEQISHCASMIGVEALKRIAAVKTTDAYEKEKSGEKLKIQLHEILLMDVPLETKNTVASELAYLEFAVTVHRLYIQRFMNKFWKIRLVNIKAETEHLQECLRYFEQWRLGTEEYAERGNKSIARKLRERFFLSTQTYRNLKFAVCGFMEYSRLILTNPSAKGVDFVPAGHSNTSALESRFSMVKRNGLNDTSKYEYMAANLNSIATLKHKRRDEKTTARKMKKGNTSYPAELIAPERHEAASIDFTVGKLVQQRKNTVDCCFRKWEASLLHSTSKPPAIETVVALPSRAPRTKLCQILLSRLQTQQIPEGNYAEMLRKEETIRDLMILTVESPDHWDTMQMFFSETGSIAIRKECMYMVQLAFELLDEATSAAKLSHKASFWWQVMNRMRDGSLHENSPNPTMSMHIRSYLFQFLSGRLFSWSIESFQEQRATTNNPQHILPGANIDRMTVGTDVNTFVGFTLFSLKKRYGNIEVLAPGYEEEDKFWLLTDMVASEAEIAMNDEYLSK